MFCRGACDSVGRELAHAPWHVRAACVSGHALARIVHRVLGLLHRVVRFRLDHCHHVSAYEDNVGGGWQAQRVGDAWASRAAEVASASAERVRARCVSGEPADGQPVASDSSTAAKLFDVQACCHVRACARLARRARVVRACRACSARVCSCARRSAASAGAAVARPRQWRSPVRDMPLFRVTQSRLRYAMRAYTKRDVGVHKIFARRRRACAFCAVCVPRLRPTPCCSVLLSVTLQPPLRHGAQANVGIRKSQEAAKQNGSISSFSAPGRDWQHNLRCRRSAWSDGVVRDGRCKHRGRQRDGRCKYKRAVQVHAWEC